MKRECECVGVGRGQDTRHDVMATCRTVRQVKQGERLRRSQNSYGFVTGSGNIVVLSGLVYMIRN